MSRNYRLRLVLLMMLLVPRLTMPVLGAPGSFSKNTPENGATRQSLFPTLSWEDSAGAIGYEYCYDMINNNICDGTWISSGTVTLPPSRLAYNTTYYWQVRAIDAGPGITLTYANDGAWWSFTTQNPALAVDKALTNQSATPVALGTVLTYTITTTNTGDVTLSNVVVSDTVLTPASKNCGILTLGATCVLTGSYVVQESDFLVGQIVNRATAAANAPNGDPLAPVTDTITTPLVAASPVAYPDPSLGNPIGQAVTVAVLANDARGDLPLDPTSVMIVNPPPGSSLILGKLLVVPGQGYWVVDTATGAITFTPETGFTGNPTPISYTVDDVGGNTSNAAAVTVTYTPRPVANDDASLGNPVGSAVTVAVLVNDSAAPGRTLNPASVHIGSTANPGASLVVPGQGVWSVYTITGAITFTPEAGLQGNPTLITYTVADDQDNISYPAMVTVTHTVPPVANDDVSLGNPVGSAVTVAVLANDVVGDRPFDPASVQIAGTVDPGGSLGAPGQGTWSVNTTTGAITFTPEASLVGDPTLITYTVGDDQGNISNPATVTITYTRPPVANDDASLGNTAGSAVALDVLDNDAAAPGRMLVPASVRIVGADAGSDGKRLTVVGEGVWMVAPSTGIITFTPEVTFEGNPMSIVYLVDDDQGNTSNPATVTVTYTDNPLARNDVSLGNPVGSVVTVTVVANDRAAPDRTLNLASVWITDTAQPGASLVVTGQGTWSVYTATGAITFTPEAGLQGNPTPITYTVTDDQGNISNPAMVTVTYTEVDGGFFVHLPLVVLHWPPIPAVPVLNAIDNPNGYGEYTVSWSSAERAISYILQESTDGGFSDAVQVYSDTHTSTILSDRGPTRYYYRVQARNAYGESTWSNVQAVDVLWEKEPNDDAIPQANGPLISGVTYYGRFSSGADKQDYFYIDLPNPQMVELWLSNIAVGQDYDLILRNAAMDLVGYSGELGNAIEHIRTITLPAGRYYIQVYNRSSSGSTQAYQLRVAHPAMGFTTAEGNLPALAIYPHD